MTRTRIFTVIAAAGLLAAAAQAPAAERMTTEDFRQEIVGLPLCGTPTDGPLAGKSVCTVHQPDGTAVLAGAGIIVRGVWSVEDGRICRRNANEGEDRKHCVDYERLGKGHFRNSDGVESCIGPCP
jgi:hypothetical protein